jgi:hypothetical protein
MDTSKPYFERIPIEAVKKIAHEFPAKKELGDDENMEAPAGDGEPPKPV